MIDQHKLYLKINWIIYFTFTLLSMYIIIITNIDITEVANSFYIINPYHIHKYLINEMPLIILYPIVQLTNNNLYKEGYYRRFIKRRIRNDIRLSAGITDYRMLKKYTDKLIESGKIKEEKPNFKLDHRHVTKVYVIG